VKLEHLKKVRLVVSLSFFVLTGLIFLDFTNVFPSGWTNGVLYLQFVPSLMKFVNVVNLAAIGFLITVVLTLLFGRVYCSSICPLGTLQDVISFLARKNHAKYIRPFNALRYSLLVITLLSVFSGSLVILNLLDPFSNFGRIFTNLFKPIVVASNNAIAFAMQNIGAYSVYAVEMKGNEITSVLISLAILGVLLWMAYFHRRLYCNTICPVGALLGWMSKFSFYKIAIDENACIGCKKCEQVCKGGCIDKKAKTVDFTRCVSCYNCFSVCPTEGLVFERAYLEPRVITPDAIGELATVHSHAVDRETLENDACKTDYGRRDVVIKSFLFLTGTTTVGKKRIVSTKESTVKVVRTTPVAPPGSMSISDFNDACTACHLCVSACPSQVLAPSFLEYGIAGIVQPHMDYSKGFCSYECTLCTEICPSGAMLPLLQEKKKLTQLGVAKFVKDNCIVKTENKECGACSEHCPTKAVNMVAYKPENSVLYKQLVIPEVKEDYCIGCGACEFACPTKPYKAIYVEGREIHATAKKPEVKKLEEEVQEDFPF
jgi:ferredoxin